jgi:eukaryotic-like serine/threonine-protein kinase
MALTSGSKLGPYEILAPLGAGGMGRCIELETTDWGGTWQSKYCRLALLRTLIACGGLSTEARAVGMLSHPNILSIYDIGTIAGAPYMVSELLEGQTYAKACAPCRCHCTRR